MTLFTDTSLALAHDGVLPITDFGITIKSRYEAEIYYTVGGQDASAIVDIKVAISPREAGNNESPGFHASAEIIDIFGLSVAEKHAYDKWSIDNGIEEELLHAIEGGEK